MKTKWSFQPFEKTAPYHFWLLQLIGLFYFGLRFLSRDYTIYGWLSFDDWNYPREISFELLPYEAIRFSTFHFIYEFIPIPSATTILYMQWTAGIACALGVLGILPKICSVIAFLLGMHFTGFIAATNGDIEGAIVGLAALFALAIAPRKAFYRFQYLWMKDVWQKSEIYRWPVFFFMMLTGAFYSFAGFEKLVETGPHWPFVLHNEYLAEITILRSIFLSDRLATPELAQYLLHPLTSYPGGIVSMYAEFCCISVLWWRRGRSFIVLSLAILHVTVYYLAGINFIGSTFLLLLLLDVNRWWVPLNLRLPNEEIHEKFKRLKKWDWLGRIEIHNDENHRLEAKEDEEVFTGVEALERVFVKIPVLFPLAILSSIPGGRRLNQWFFIRAGILRAGDKV